MRLKIAVVCVVIAVITLLACTKNSPVVTARPVIHLSVDSLHFEAVAGDTFSPPNQYVFVTNTGVDTLRYQVMRKAPWLFAGSLGEAPDSITVYAMPKDMSTGMYVDTILVTSNNASNSPQRIIVTFTVFGAMDVIPRILKFRMATGGPVPVDSPIVVVNNTAGGLNFSVASTSGRWRVTPSSGLAPDTVMAGIDTTGLASGTYLDTLTFSSPDAVNSPLVVVCSLYVAPWIRQNPGLVVRLADVRFLNENRGIAVGFLPSFPSKDGVILNTSNGGVTWQLYPVSYESSPLGGIDFYDDQFGCIVGDTGTILRTLDGGANWTPESTHDTATNLWSVQIVTPDTAFAVGTNGAIYRSVDSCQHWSLQISGVTSSLASVYFISQQEGWIVGNNGVLLHTTNGGDEWQKIGLGITSDLWRITFVGASHGWLVGGDGTVLATSNGGATWTSQTSPTSKELRNVQFIDLLHGWSIGQAGTILRTTNGGTTWLDKSMNLDQTLFGLDFLDGQRGWVVGDSSTILTTWSGGL
jgi:photosystem II stability/assembly factor-like uncharacterized protein